MRSGYGGLILFGFLMVLFMLAIIFIPIIFGSMESNIDLTNNTTHAVYNTTTPIVMSSRTLFWVGGALCGLFMVVGILIWRGTR